MESEANKIGLGDRWRIAARKIDSRLLRKAAAQAQLQTMVAQLLQRAEREKWSERELLVRIVIQRGTFYRLRHQQINPLKWLPKLKAAAARLAPPR